MEKLAAFKVALVAWAAATPKVIAARWPAITWASNGMLTLVGTLVLCLVLITGLVLGPLSASRGKVAAGSPSPSELGSPTPTATDRSFDPYLFTESPSGTVDPMAPRTPEVLASVDCTAASVTPVTTGGKLYVACGDGEEVIAIDLATDKVARRYSINRPDIQQSCVMACIGFDRAPYAIAIYAGLWVGWDSSPGGKGPEVRHYSLDTGSVIDDVFGTTLVGSGFGVVWIMQWDGLKSVDSYSPIPDPGNGYGAGSDWTNAAIGCDSVYQWHNGSTPEVARTDPESEEMTWSGTESAIEGVIQAGNLCWAVTISGSSYRLARLGKTCVDMHSRDISSRPFALGSTYWSWVNDPTYGTYGIQEIDLFHSNTGPTWSLPADGIVVAAQGQVWARSGGQFTRFAIPLDPLPAQPWPTPACTSGAPLASPSPSATPTVTPTASPAHEPTLPASPSAAAASV